MKKKFLKWFKVAGIRAIKTVAQTVAGLPEVREGE